MKLNVSDGVFDAILLHYKNQGNLNFAVLKKYPQDAKWDDLISSDEILGMGFLTLSPNFYSSLSNNPNEYPMLAFQHRLQMAGMIGNHWTEGGEGVRVDNFVDDNAQHLRNMINEDIDILGNNQLSEDNEPWAPKPERGRSPINKNEAEALMRFLAQPTVQSPIQPHIAKLLDLDHNSFLTREEIQEVAKSTGVPEMLEDSDFVHLLKGESLETRQKILKLYLEDFYSFIPGYKRSGP